MAFPKTAAGIRSRIKSYEAKLRAEKRKFGCYDDSAGIRFSIGPMYLALGDQAGALKAFAWFDKQFAVPGHGRDSSPQVRLMRSEA
jgi:hypothetical protein